MDQPLSTLSSSRRDPTTPTTNRYRRSCDRCRQKKIKCDLGIPNCGPCAKHDTTCLLTPRRRVKRREKTSVETRTALFESRLVRMEELLKSSGCLLAELHPSSSSLTETGSRHRKGHADQEARDLSRPTAKDENFSQNFFVGLHAKSQPSIVSIHPITTQPPFEEALTSEYQERRHEPLSSTVNDPRSRPSKPRYMELPPKRVALSLVHLYFSQLNQMLPLFSQPVYMQLFDELYLSESHSYQTSAAWCSIHVVLALANCLAAMSPRASGHERMRCADHLKNALSLAPDILLHGTDLLSVQALLGIAVVLQGISNPRPCSILVAASARLAHRIGLYQEVDRGSDLSPVEIQQRKRVLWLVNILDKNVSLHFKIPPLINPDVDIPLPNGDFDDSIGRIYLNGGEGELDTFNLRIRLSIISGSVYENLYSTTARKRSDESRTAAVQSLDEMLNEWRERMTIGLSLDDLVQRLDRFPTIQLAVLYSFYFNILTMVHQRPASGKSKTEKSTSTVQAFDPLQFAPHVSCVKAAREFLFLINSIPGADYGYIWFVLHPAISAIITLLHHVLHNPQKSNCAALIECVGPMMEIFPTIFKGCQNEDAYRDIFRMGTFCVELRRRAMVAMNTYRTMSLYTDF